MYHATSSSSLATTIGTYTFISIISSPSQLLSSACILYCSSLDSSISFLFSRAECMFHNLPRSSHIYRSDVGWTVWYASLQSAIILSLVFVSSREWGRVYLLVEWCWHFVWNIWMREDEWMGVSGWREGGESGLTRDTRKVEERKIETWWDLELGLGGLDEGVKNRWMYAGSIRGEEGASICGHTISALVG